MTGRRLFRRRSSSRSPSYSTCFALIGLTENNGLARLALDHHLQLILMALSSPLAQALKNIEPSLPTGPSSSSSNGYSGADGLHLLGNTQHCIGLLFPRRLSRPHKTASFGIACLELTLNETRCLTVQVETHYASNGTAISVCPLETCSWRMTTSIATRDHPAMVGTFFALGRSRNLENIA